MRRIPKGGLVHKSTCKPSSGEVHQALHLDVQWLEIALIFGEQSFGLASIEGRRLVVKFDAAGRIEMNLGARTHDIGVWHIYS